MSASLQPYLSQRHVEQSHHPDTDSSLCQRCWALIQNNPQDYTSVFVLLAGKVKNLLPPSLLSSNAGWTSPLIGLLLLVDGRNGLEGFGEIRVLVGGGGRWNTAGKCNNPAFEIYERSISGTIRVKLWREGEWERGETYYWFLLLWWLFPCIHQTGHTNPIRGRESSIRKVRSRGNDCVVHVQSYRCMEKTQPFLSFC